MIRKIKERKGSRRGNTSYGRDAGSFAPRESLYYTRTGYRAARLGMCPWRVRRNMKRKSEERKDALQGRQEGKQSIEPPPPPPPPPPQSRHITFLMRKDIYLFIGMRLFLFFFPFFLLFFFFAPFYILFPFFSFIFFALRPKSFNRVDSAHDATAGGDVRRERVRLGRDRRIIQINFPRPRGTSARARSRPITIKTPWKTEISEPKKMLYGRGTPSSVSCRAV